MAATKQDIREWLARGKKENATHVIVVCDSFDYDDYPVMVKKGQDAFAIAKEYDEKNMQRVMEVYNLSMDIEKQLNEHRAFHY